MLKFNLFYQYSYGAGLLKKNPSDRLNEPEFSGSFNQQHSFSFGKAGCYKPVEIYTS